MPRPSRSNHHINCLRPWPPKMKLQKRCVSRQLQADRIDLRKTKSVLPLFPKPGPHGTLRSQEPQSLKERTCNNPRRTRSANPFDVEINGMHEDSRLNTIYCTKPSQAKLLKRHFRKVGQRDHQWAGTGQRQSELLARRRAFCKGPIDYKMVAPRNQNRSPTLGGSMTVLS